MAMPKNAHEFQEFMLKIWDTNCKPCGGGVHLKPHPEYDRWHNAKATAKFCGARRTGGTKVDGENWHVYRFPNDGPFTVRINLEGSAIRIGVNQRK